MPVATHRLPHVFAGPDRYDPDRFAPPREEAKRTPYALVTFGGGPRICIGISFAQVEMKAAAAHILRRYTLEPSPERPPLHYYYGVTASVPSGIHVRVRPRRAGEGERSSISV
jgi:cytochrome P450